MAKQIIILSVNRDLGGENLVTFILWFPVAVGKEMPRPAANSSYAGVTVEELAAIRTGQVIEECKSMYFPLSFSRAQVQGFLVMLYNDKINYFAGKPYPGEFYGSYYDGASWL